MKGLFNIILPIYRKLRKDNVPYLNVFAMEQYFYMDSRKGKDMGKYIDFRDYEKVSADQDSILYSIEEFDNKCKNIWNSTSLYNSVENLGNKIFERMIKNNIENIESKVKNRIYKMGPYEKSPYVFLRSLNTDEFSTLYKQIVAMKSGKYMQKENDTIPPDRTFSLHRIK